MSDYLPKKSLGQHWLHNDPTLKNIVAAGDITSNDVVLEIGPGLGTLTEKLLQAAGKVIAVEFDAELAAMLKNKIQDPKLEVVCDDILRFDLTKLPKNYKIVANIPYYLTSNLVRRISTTTNPPVTVVLLIQKEVAQRMAAEPGSMSILAVTAQYYWHVELADEVAASLFTPPPKVDSQVVVLKHRKQPLFMNIDEPQFFQLVKHGFAQKRKTLVNSLAAGFHLAKDVVSTKLVNAKINPSARAQTLSLEEWYRLYQEF